MAFWKDPRRTLHSAIFPTNVAITHDRVVDQPIALVGVCPLDQLAQAIDVVVRLGPHGVVGGKKITVAPVECRKLFRISQRDTSKRDLGHGLYHQN